MQLLYRQWPPKLLTDVKMKEMTRLIAKLLHGSGAYGKQGKRQEYLSKSENNKRLNNPSSMFVPTMPALWSH